MKRLLQFGTLLFLLVTFLTPLMECFDRWDAAGISNDTEFAVFTLIFALCLVLLVSVLLAARALLSYLISSLRLHPPEAFRSIAVASVFEMFIPPLNSSPLRI
jgi:hypothetical protein